MYILERFPTQWQWQVKVTVSVIGISQAQEDWMPKQKSSIANDSYIPTTVVPPIELSMLS